MFELSCNCGFNFLGAIVIIGFIAVLVMNFKNLYSLSNFNLRKNNNEEVSLSEDNSYVDYDDFYVRVDIRIANSEDREWKDHVDAQIGDTVEIQMEYKNISDQVHKNVMIREILPENLHYVTESTIIYNAGHEKGARVVGDNFFSVGINIGNYAPGANAFVRFSAVVIDDSLREGPTTLCAWSQCGIGEKTNQDFTYVVVNKPQTV